MEASGQFHTPVALPPAKKPPPPAPTNRRLGGPQSRFGRGSEEETAMHLTEIESQSSSP
jgi:hypothetical protein